MKKDSTIFLQLVIVLLGIVTLALLLWEPTLEGRNAHATLIQVYVNDPFLALVYLGSAPFFVALSQAIKVLRAVERHTVFSQHAVNSLRTIQYCAIAIIGFVALEGVVILLNHGNDDSAGGVFMGVFIAFASIVIATAAAMCKRVLQHAVTMHAENDRTVFLECA